MDRNLAEAGASIGRAVVKEDPLREPVVIADDFFRDRTSGALKIKKFGRHRFARLIARTLMDPDEIWWQWEIDDPAKRKPTTAPRTPGLRRRYFARWRIDGEDVNAVIVLDIGKDGWRGVTAFVGDKDSNLGNKVRGGTLGYRRSDKVGG